MLNRRGTSLLELMIATALAALVLGTATTSVLRQQQVHTRIRSVSAADLQAGSASLVLASQLSWLERDDLVSGQASDTALQLRAPVGLSFACDTSAGAVTLLPEVSDDLPSGANSLPEPGDSLWWLGDSTWSAAEITSVASVLAHCTFPFTASGQAIHISLSRPDTIQAGAPVRVTRQTRLGTYRSGDGTWQLGFREWNASLAAFAAPQPVAGPLIARSIEHRSGFRYFDQLGNELDAHAQPGATSNAARIRLTTATLLVVHNQGQDSVRTDSIDVALRIAVPR